MSTALVTPAPVTSATGTRSKALTCTAAVALMVGATRWGSYIGVNPLFLTDVLIACSVVDRAIARSMSGPVPVNEGFRSRVPVGLLLLVTYAALRMFFSGSYVGTVTWLRDGAPYLYVALGLVSAHAVARATPETISRTVVWLWRALIFHLAWVCIVGPLEATSALASARPLFAGGLFYGKPDTDSAILGLTAGLLLRRLLLGQTRGRCVLGLVAVAYGASTFTNRAGFIAIILCCALSFGLTYASTGRASLRRVGMLLAVPVVAVAAIALLPSTTVGSRLVATVDPSKASSVAQENAVGTTDARRKTWSGVLSWTESDQSRTLVGAGMGVDFLAASGTLQYLEGTDYENVRSPHDYFIGSFARLGLVGVGLIVAIMLSLVRRTFTFRKRIAEDELLSFCALTVVGLVAVASFGVVLEAPFGAVPFWWATGVLLALVRIEPRSTSGALGDELLVDRQE